MAQRAHRLPITFFFPYREVSGLPVLFARLARHLAEHGAAQVRVIDYPDGHQARTLRDVRGVELVSFADGEPVAVGPDERLVMQAILPATIRPELEPSPETRLFFWTLHPMNLIQTILPSQRGRDFQARHPAWNRRVLELAMHSHRHAMESFIQTLLAKGGLAFMDGTTLDSTASRLGMDLHGAPMLPVPVDIPVTRRRTQPVAPPGALHVAWLGRIADFKVHILTYTMERLSRWAEATRTRVTMHIIGDGPEMDRLPTSDVSHEYFRIVLAGRMAASALDEYLVSRIDLLAAMGTSALEGARLGIPTILLDAAYGPIRGDYRFRWLFEAERYSLAELVGPRNFEPGNTSLERMLSELGSQYDRLSERTYTYCHDTHSLDEVGDRFARLVSETDFRWRDITPDLRRKSAVRKAYEWLRAPR